jgi:hypothetical protein
MKKTSVLAIIPIAFPVALLLTTVTRPASAGLGSSVAAAPRAADDDAIRRAFEDVLDRQPSSRELRRYRDRMENENWSERDVRDDLRSRDARSIRSTARTRSRDEADRIVRRAYRDVLHREPDAEGLRNYRRGVMDEGWTEAEVRAALRKSPEYRDRNHMTRARAEDIVRQAYLSVLGREPDANSRGYVDGVMREHWSQEEVERQLRRSDEYRTRH